MTIKAKRVAVILGAGASIDAGLPNTNHLTSLVYDRLSSSFDKVPATLFGYVVSKLVARGARDGASPFAPISVEAVYETILRLMNRSSDPLSEFVYSWDPIFSSLRKPFDEAAFVRAVKAALYVDSQRSFSGGLRIGFKPFRLEEAAKTISQGIVSDRVGEGDIGKIVSAIVKALVDELSVPLADTAYIDQLVDFCLSNDATVATLNYDTLYEEAAERQGSQIDYGISDWNARKQVAWSRDSKKLLKLHGSLNWYQIGEDIRLKQPE